MRFLINVILIFNRASILLILANHRIQKESFMYICIKKRLLCHIYFIEMSQFGSAAMDLIEQYRIAEATKALNITGASQTVGNPIFNLKKFEWERKAGRNQEQLANRNRIIQEVVVSNNVVIIATTNCYVLRWNVTDANREPERIEIPVSVPAVAKGASGAVDLGEGIDHIFIDPTANHVIISMKNMDNYYLHSRSQRPKKLSRLQGAIECIAFDKHNCTEAATRSFLVGTSLGVIYEMAVDSSGKERHCQPVYQLEHAVPICSIYFDSIGSSGGGSGGGGGVAGGGAGGAAGGVSGLGIGLGAGLAASAFTAAASSALSSVGGGGGSGGGSNANNNLGVSGSGAGGGGFGEGARYFVMWSIAAPATRLYHLTGGPSLQALFAAYLTSGTTSYTELPAAESSSGGGSGGMGGAGGASSQRRPQLYCYTGKGGGVGANGGQGGVGMGNSAAQQFALMTETGIYHGSLLFSNSASSAE